MTANQALASILNSDKPGQELRVQHHSGLLKTYLPEVDALYGVPQRSEFHPEIDVGWHMELCLDQAHALGFSSEVKFAVLLHDLGKGITPADMLPRHFDHERTGMPLVMNVCERLGIVGFERHLAMKVCEFHLWLHKVFTHRSTTVSRFIHDHFRDHTEVFVRQFTQACHADATGRLGKQSEPYAQAAFFLSAYQRLDRLPMTNATPGEDPEQLLIYNQRRQMIRFLRKVHDTNITRADHEQTRPNIRLSGTTEQI